MLTMYDAPDRAIRYRGSGQPGDYGASYDIIRNDFHALIRVVAILQCSWTP